MIDDSEFAAVRLGKDWDEIVLTGSPKDEIETDLMETIGQLYRLVGPINPDPVFLSRLRMFFAVPPASLVPVANSIDHRNRFIATSQIPEDSNLRLRWAGFKVTCAALAAVMLIFVATTSQLDRDSNGRSPSVPAPNFQAGELMEASDSCDGEPRSRIGLEGLLKSATPQAAATESSTAPYEVVWPSGTPATESEAIAIEHAIAAYKACVDSGDVLGLLGLFSDRLIQDALNEPNTTIDSYLSELAADIQQVGTVEIRTESVTRLPSSQIVAVVKVETELEGQIFQFVFIRGNSNWVIDYVLDSFGKALVDILAPVLEAP